MAPRRVGSTCNNRAARKARQANLLTAVKKTYCAMLDQGSRGLCKNIHEKHAASRTSTCTNCPSTNSRTLPAKPSLPKRGPPRIAQVQSERAQRVHFILAMEVSAACKPSLTKRDSHKKQSSELQNSFDAPHDLHKCCRKGRNPCHGRIRCTFTDQARFLQEEFTDQAGFPQEAELRIAELV